MIARQDLLALNFSGVAVSAKLRPDGTLEPVGGSLDKLLAVRHSKALPRVHTLLLAKGQRAEHEKLLAAAASPVDPRPYGDLKLDDPHAGFVVHFAKDIQDAVRAPGLRC